MPSEVLLRGGMEIEGKDLEDIELWVKGSRAQEIDEYEEEDGPGSPL